MLASPRSPRRQSDTTPVTAAMLGDPSKEDVQFVCPDGACGFTFKSRDKLVKHVQKYHEELSAVIAKQ